MTSRTTHKTVASASLLLVLSGICLVSLRAGAQDAPTSQPSDFTYIDLGAMLPSDTQSPTPALTPTAQYVAAYLDAYYAPKRLELMRRQTEALETIAYELRMIRMERDRVIRGDFSGDGKVNTEDINPFAQWLTQQQSQP